MILSDFRLPRRLRRTLEAVAPVVCPDELESLGLLGDVMDQVDLTIRTLPDVMRAGVVAGLSAFELGAVAQGFRLRGFSKLPLEARRAYFATWWHSPLPPIRTFAKLLKAILTQAYFEQPAVRARLEYHPDRWIAERAKQRFEQWADEIRRHEEDLVAPNPLIAPARLLRQRRA